MIRIFNPQLIAESADMPGPTLDQMIDFVIDGGKLGRLPAPASATYKLARAKDNGLLSAIRFS
jgi:hypothetical protein